MSQSNPPLRSASCMPGAVILFRESGPEFPLWPSVYLTDAATPKSFLETRPHGYYNAVLKLAPVLDASFLRWAQRSQMIPFDPLAEDEDIKISTPGLSDAYAVASEAERSGYDLDYWKVILASSQDQGPTVIDSENEDWDNDPELLLAIRLGIIDGSTQKTRLQSPLPTVCSTSHPHSRGLQLPIRKTTQRPPRPMHSAPSSSSPTDRYSAIDYYPGPSKRLSPFSIKSNDERPVRSPKRRLDDYIKDSIRKTSPPISYISSDDDDDDGERPSPPLRIRRRPCAATEPIPVINLLQPSIVAPDRSSSLGLTAGEVFRRNGFKTSASVAPKNDIVEENLDESNQFVQVYVGPELDPASDSDVDPVRRRYRLQLLKNHVWDRPYFRDNVSARNYFEPIGDNTWELVHPRLADILPGDFRWAAEFLSDGDFGHRAPEDEEQVAETLAQCMSAWRTAELLSMDDLLEHIVEKIRATQAWWDLWNVMAFACFIYQSEVSLQAHQDLKAMFSEYIAELYFVYLEDEMLSSSFLTRLMELPELERDVLKKRIKRLETDPQLQQNVATLQDEDDSKDLGGRG